MDPRFEVDCTYCGYTISKREPKFRMVEGFERLRTVGGANQIYLRTPQYDEKRNEIYACESCISLRQKRLESQMVLVG